MWCKTDGVSCDCLSSGDAVGCMDVYKREEGIADDLLRCVDHCLEPLPLSLVAA